MNKVFQDQLSKLASSLGLKVKNHSNVTLKTLQKNKTKYLTLNNKNIIKLAHYGRKGKKIRLKKHNDISAFLDFMGKCKQKGEISDIDEFFCLCAVENIEDYHIDQINLFRKHLCDADERITALINLSKLSGKDIESHLRYVPTIKYHRETLRKQEDMRAFDHYISMAKNVLFSGIDTDAKIASTPILYEEDINLSIEWIQDKNLQNELRNYKNFGVLIDQYEKDKEAGDTKSAKAALKEIGRVLSARAAEKAAKLVYEQNGAKVEDVSIQPLRQRNLTDWKYFDLKVDGYPVDIKNSRRSLSSRDRYVEHCVPKFKSVRNDVNVRIAGILSQDLRPKNLFEPEKYPNRDTSLLFLGETDFRIIEQLRKEFSSAHFEIDFGRPAHGAKYFLPPWVFNYPSNLYERRDVAIAALKKLSIVDYNLCQQKKFNCIPSCLAANINLSGYWPKESLKTWEWDLYHRIFSCVSEQGLFLPFLYLTLLSHFTEMISSNSEQCKDYQPYQYRRFVFMNNDEYNKPLGIYDPLYIIKNLIDILDNLWSANHDLVKKYKYFKLSGFHIFQGKSQPHERWETLIAYCGGWIERKGKCGKYPLVLGKSVHCDKCKKLICPICRFCSEGCENCYAVDMEKNDYHRSEENDKSLSDDVPF